MKEFKAVKEDLGLGELGKEKKEIRKEIGEAARDNEPAITLKERTGRMLQESERLEAEAEELQQGATAGTNTCCKPFQKGNGYRRRKESETVNAKKAERQRIRKQGKASRRAKRKSQGGIAEIKGVTEMAKAAVTAAVVKVYAPPQNRN